MMAWAWLAFAFLNGGSLRVARRMAWGSRALPESRAGAAALAAKAGRSAFCFTTSARQGRPLQLPFSTFLFVYFTVSVSFIFTFFASE